MITRVNLLLQCSNLFFNCCSRVWGSTRWPCGTIALSLVESLFCSPIQVPPFTSPAGNKELWSRGASICGRGSLFPTMGLWDWWWEVHSYMQPLILNFQVCSKIWLLVRHIMLFERQGRGPTKCYTPSNPFIMSARDYSHFYQVAAFYWGKNQWILYHVPTVELLCQKASGSLEILWGLPWT